MVAFAHRAEELGLDSLWVPERILRQVPPAREPLLAAFVNVILLFWLMTFVVGGLPRPRRRRVAASPRRRRTRIAFSSIPPFGSRGPAACPIVSECDRGLTWRPRLSQSVGINRHWPARGFVAARLGLALILALASPSCTTEYMLTAEPPAEPDVLRAAAHKSR